jgi:hypothetical protein
MMEDIKDVNRVLKELGVDIADVKSITLRYERIFESKAYPVFKLKLRKKKL